MALTYKLETSPEARVTLHGHLADGTLPVLKAAAALLGKVCAFDLTDVTVTNSAGIRDLMAFAKGLGKTIDIVLDRCPPHLVLTLNMVPELACRVRVRSVICNFACPQCRADLQAIVEIGTDVGADGAGLKAYPCRTCGTVTVPAFDVDDYFDFLQTRAANRRP